MRKLRSIPKPATTRLRAIWPLDHPDHPGTPPSPTPAERVIGKISGYTLAVKIWPAGDRPPDPDAVWHPFGGGCWVAVRVG